MSAVCQHLWHVHCRLQRYNQISLIYYQVYIKVKITDLPIKLVKFVLQYDSVSNKWFYIPSPQESTLKSVLSALWNLSAHSTENKVAIGSVDGALGFLVSTLTYRCQTNSLAIIESGGGILRNVSSLIATRDDYRYHVYSHSQIKQSKYQWHHLSYSCFPISGKSSGIITAFRLCCSTCDLTVLPL